MPCNGSNCKAAAQLPPPLDLGKQAPRPSHLAIHGGGSGQSASIIQSGSLTTEALYSSELMPTTIGMSSTIPLSLGHPSLLHKKVSALWSKNW